MNKFMMLSCLCLVLTSWQAHSSIFDGKEKVIIVNGYSTSFHWPNFLQRKLDKYLDGNSYITVKQATNGGTPIYKWMDIESGNSKKPWDDKLSPIFKQNQNKEVIVLAQQSLQWVYGSRSAGIKNSADKAGIKKGVDVLKLYTDKLLNEGADKVFVAMHIYKEGMEPQIGNERLALESFMKQKPKNVFEGPDVWEPTKEHYPQAFASDKVHPSSMGSEIMAQKWFETLLKYDSLEVPSWSQEELTEAIENTGSNKMASTSGARSRTSRRLPDFIMKKYDKNGDGKLDEAETQALEQARKARGR